MISGNSLVGGRLGTEEQYTLEKGELIGQYFACQIGKTKMRIPGQWRIGAGYENDYE